MKKLNTADWVALILVIIGGLNWGLKGAFNLDLVSAIFGDASIISRIVYILVGAAAVYVMLVVVKPGKQNE